MDSIAPSLLVENWLFVVLGGAVTVVNAAAVYSFVTIDQRRGRVLLDVTPGIIRTQLSLAIVFSIVSLGTTIVGGWSPRVGIGLLLLNPQFWLQANPFQDTSIAFTEHGIWHFGRLLTCDKVVEWHWRAHAPDRLAIQPQKSGALRPETLEITIADPMRESAQQILADFIPEGCQTVGQAVPD